MSSIEAAILVGLAAAVLIPTVGLVLYLVHSSRRSSSRVAAFLGRALSQELRPGEPGRISFVAGASTIHGAWLALEAEIHGPVTYRVVATATADGATLATQDAEVTVDGDDTSGLHQEPVGALALDTYSSGWGRTVRWRRTERIMTFVPRPGATVEVTLAFWPGETTTVERSRLLVTETVET